MASQDHAPSISGGRPQEAPSEGAVLTGASGATYGADVPWTMPTPTDVSSTKDGFPSGRHMIDGFRMMATAARTSGGKRQKELAEVYAAVALCIENEARRADRAEARLVALGFHPFGNRPPGDGVGRDPRPTVADGDRSRDEPK